MPKKFLSKYIPKPASVSQNRWLRLLGSRILDHNLWHLNRRSTANGVFIGLLAAFIPLPVQTLTVGILCLLSRSNLPVGLLLTWVSNPLTFIPLFFFSYEVGNLVLRLDNPVHMDMFALDQFATTVQTGWKPLFLGCAITGIAVASFGYAATHGLWRYNVLKQRKKRRLRAAQPRPPVSANDEMKLACQPSQPSATKDSDQQEPASSSANHDSTSPIPRD